MKDGRVELTDIIGDFSAGQVVGMCLHILDIAEQQKPVTFTPSSKLVGLGAAKMLEACGLLRNGGPAMKFIITDQGKSACEKLRILRAAHGTARTAT